MFSSLCLVSFIAVASAFQNNVGRVSTTSLNAKSTSLPFLEKPPALNGKYPGDVGFDPVGFTSLWADVSLELIHKKSQRLIFSLYLVLF
jgi:hypothetical protein